MSAGDFCIYNFEKVDDGFYDYVPLTVDFWLFFVILPQALKTSPGCIHRLVSRVLPYIGPILDTVRVVRVISTSIVFRFCNSCLGICF